jgi:hypothetical protein
MRKFNLILLVLILVFIPLYPKFPLLGISGSYVSVRLDDFVVAMVFAVFLAQSLRRRFSDFFTPTSRAILLYLFTGVVATFAGIFVAKSADLGQGFLHTFRRFEYFSLFFCGFAFVKSLSDLRFLVKVILITSFIVALYGLGQAFLNFPVISTTNSEFSKGLALTLGPGARINSTFAGHYDLAAFSIFPLLLIIALLPLSKPKWPLLIIGATIYWTLLLSASRITFVSFVATSSLLMMVIHKRLWLVPLGFLVIIGVLLSPQLRGRYLELITTRLHLSAISVVYAQTDSSPSATVNKNVQTVADALQAPAVPEDRSFNIRLQVEWPRAIRAFKKNPVLGTGFSSVGLAVDNDPLRSLAETGILGTIAFLLIFIRFFKTSLRYLLKYSLNPDLVSAVVATFSLSLLGLLINSLFIDVFTASKIALTTWCLMGITEKAKHL